MKGDKLGLMHRHSCRLAAPCLLCIVLKGEKVAVPSFVVIQPGMHRSRAGAGRSHCVKPFTE